MILLTAHWTKLYTIKLAYLTTLEKRPLSDQWPQFDFPSITFVLYFITIALTTRNSQYSLQLKINYQMLLLIHKM